MKIIRLGSGSSLKVCEAVFLVMPKNDNWRENARKAIKLQLQGASFSMEDREKIATRLHRYDLGAVFDLWQCIGVINRDFTVVAPCSIWPQYNRLIGLQLSYPNCQHSPYYISLLQRGLISLNIENQGLVYQDIVSLTAEQLY